jgi:hypothetical protein
MFKKLSIVEDIIYIALTVFVIWQWFQKVITWEQCCIILIIMDTTMIRRQIFNLENKIKPALKADE